VRVDCIKCDWLADAHTTLVDSKYTGCHAHGEECVRECDQVHNWGEGRI
jgi:hypothetical protein